MSAQVSGSTANDFSNSVVYTVTAEDSSSVNYTVTVTDLAWTERTSAGNRNWYSLASSVDGTKLIACGISATTNIGYLYTSTDSGAT